MSLEFSGNNNSYITASVPSLERDYTVEWWQYTKSVESDKSVKFIDGDASDNLYGIALDANDNIYVGGSSNSSSLNGFARPSLQQQRTCGFVCKLDKNYNVNWHKWIDVSGYSGTPFVRVNKIKTDTKGNTYAYGVVLNVVSYSGSIVIDGIAEQRSATGMFLIKFGVNGNVLWVKNIILTSVQPQIDIDVDRDNNVYITIIGLYAINDPAIVLQYSTSFVFKFTENGTELWRASIRNTSQPTPNNNSYPNIIQIKATSDGGLIVLGNLLGITGTSLSLSLTVGTPLITTGTSYHTYNTIFNTTVSFPVYPNVTPATRTWCMKLSLDGTSMLWFRSFVGLNVNSVFSDIASNIIFCGDLVQNADFGTNISIQDETGVTPSTQPLTGSISLQTVDSTQKGCIIKLNADGAYVLHAWSGLTVSLVTSDNDYNIIFTANGTNIKVITSNNAVIYSETGRIGRTIVTLNKNVLFLYAKNIEQLITDSYLFAYNNYVYFTGATNQGALLFNNNNNPQESYSSVFLGGTNGFIYRYAKSKIIFSCVPTSSFKSIGGNGNDLLYRLFVDSDENIYVCGTSNSSSLNGVTIPTIPAGSTYGYIAKLDKNYNVIWHKWIAGRYFSGADGGSVSVKHIKADSFGNVYAYGTYDGLGSPGTILIDGVIQPTYINKGAFLIKLRTEGDLSSQGLLLWIKIIENGERIGNLSVEDDSNNRNSNIYITFSATSFSINEISLPFTGTYTGLIFKFSDIGSVVWWASMTGGVNPNYCIVNNGYLLVNGQRPFNGVYYPISDNVTLTIKTLDNVILLSNTLKISLYGSFGASIEVDSGWCMQLSPDGRFIPWFRAIYGLNSYACVADNIANTLICGNIQSSVSSLIITDERGVNITNLPKRGDQPGCVIKFNVGGIPISNVWAGAAVTDVTCDNDNNIILTTKSITGNLTVTSSDNVIIYTVASDNLNHFLTLSKNFRFLYAKQIKDDYTPYLFVYNNYVYVTSYTVSSTLTIVNNNTTVEDYRAQGVGIYRYDRTSPSTLPWAFGYTNTSKAYMKVNNFIYYFGSILGSTIPTYNDKWLHFAIVRKYGVTILYIDGKSIGALYNETGGQYIDNTDQGGLLTIGALYKGYIYNFEIINSSTYTEVFDPLSIALKLPTNDKDYTIIVSGINNGILGGQLSDGTLAGVSASTIKKYNTAISQFVPAGSPISTVCFVAGTPVLTDDCGYVAIEELTDQYTINGKKIMAVSKTVTPEKYLLRVSLGAFGSGVPSADTVMTLNHRIMYMGSLMEAYKLWDMRHPGITLVEYNGASLYNVVLDQVGTGIMTVNSMEVETLDPENLIAKVYVSLKSLSVEDGRELIRVLNDCTVKTLMSP